MGQVLSPLRWKSASLCLLLLLQACSLEIRSAPGAGSGTGSGSTANPFPLGVVWITSLNPGSVGNVPSPQILGGSSVPAASVKISSDPACSVQIGSGAYSDFAAGGISVTSAANASTPIYGQVFYAGGAPASVCTLLGSYTHDNLPPTVQLLTPVTGGTLNTSQTGAVTFSGTCSENGSPVQISGASTGSVQCAGGTFSVDLDLTSLPDGMLTYTAAQTDAAGNSGTSAAVSLLKDTDVPLVDITSPADGSFVHLGNVAAWTVSGTCSENGRNVSLTGAVTATVACASGAWSTTLDLSSLAEGAFSLQADHSDAAGNAATQATRSFLKDTIAPTLTISSPAAGSFITAANAASFTLSGACSENGRNVLISGDVSGSAACTAGAWSVTLDLTSLADGPVSVTVNLTDLAGNAAAPASRSFVKDVGVPAVAITSPAGGSYVNASNASSFTIGGTCSENTRNVVISGSGSGTAVCSGGAWSATLDLSAAADGALTLTANHSDAAGNAASPASLSLTKDVGVPTLSLLSPAAASPISAAAASSFTVTGACSENGRNVVITGSASASVLCLAGGWTANLDFSAAADGAVSITVNHSDAAGNAATPALRSFVKDTALPTVDFNLPAANSYVNLANQASWTVSGTCSENGRTVTIAGAFSTTATCTAGAWTKTLDLSSLAEGSFTITADHSDAAGNGATQASRTFIKDSVAPTVALTSPAAGSPVTAAGMSAFAISGTCSENGRNVVISGAASATVACSSGAWSTTVDLSTASDGNVSLQASQTDAAGNSASSGAVTYAKDATPPAVAITAPAANAWANLANQASFTLSGTCSENGRNVVISGAASATVACAAGAWSATVDVSGAADGNFTLRADHSDAAGNGATQASRVFRKDAVAPTVAITAPAASSFITAAGLSSFTLSGTCSENGQSVSISGAVTGSAACSSGAWSATLDLSAVTDGAVTLRADLVDPAGNPAAQSSRSFTKDTNAASVAITSPAAGSAANLANVSAFALSGTCSENGRDVVVSGAASATVTCTAGAWSATLDLSSVAQGSFSLSADHSDAAGNAAATSTRVFNKDTTAPTLAISGPAANSYIGSGNESAFTVTGTCSENGRSVVISGAASATVSCLAGGWTASLDFSGASQGAVTINVNHSDSAGNPATQASRIFIKDTASPSIAITSPAANSYVTPANQASFSVSGSCSENGRNVVISGASSATVTCTAGAWSASLNLTSAPEGAISVTANHDDLAGNAATASTLALIKDSVAPTVAITSPAAGSFINSGNVGAFTVSGTCSENGRNVSLSGPVSATATCSGGTWSKTLDLSSAADGTVTIYADHSDAAGNGATQSSRAFNKASAPGGSDSIVIAGGATYTTSATVNLTLHSDNYTSQMYITNVPGCGSGGSWEPYATSKAGWTLGQANGTATVYVTYLDIAANQSPCVSDTIIHDNSAPSLAITAPAANSYIIGSNVASYTVSGTCSENGQQVILSGAASGTTNCSAGAWSIALDFSSAGQGSVTVNANHSDAAGNPAATASLTLIKDTQLPTVAITSPAASSYINSANVTAFAVSGTCSETGRNVVLSGAASATVTCSAGAWSASLDFSAASQGSLTLYADHGDAAGNAATQGSRVFVKDTALPTVAITSPAANTVISSGTQSAFTVSGTCSENTRNVVVSGDAAGSTVCTAGAWSISLDFSAAAEGTVSISVAHTDAAGNSATPATRAFIKDVLPPTVAITSPAANSFINSSNVSAFTVSGTCSENGRNVVLSGAASGTVACSSGAWSLSLNFTAASQGNVTLYADHSDAAGNNASQASRVFVKDTSAPTLAITSPAANSPINLANVASMTVSGTCSENTRTVTFSGAASGSATCSSGAWSASLDFSAAAQGNVTLTATHTDAAGNSVTDSRVFVKDTSAPALAITAPAANSYVTSATMGSFTVSGTCSENGQTVTLTGPVSTTATCTAGAWSKALDLSSLAEGSFTVYADLSDAAGNPATQASRVFIKDTVVPTVAITAPAASSYANASNYTAWTVSGTCSENGRVVSVSAGGGAVTASPSCSAGAWSATLNLGAIADGAFTVTANHSDAAGNAATQASRSFNKDIAAPGSPTISIAGGAAYTTSSTVALTLSATGTAAEMYITNTAGCASGGTWETYATSKASWTLGQANATATVYVKYRDAALNESSCVNDTIIHDSTVPTVTLTSPAASSYANASNFTAFTVSGACSENGRTVSVSAAGGTVTASPTCSAGAWTVNLNLTAIADGAFTVTADHTDAAGNSATQASRSFNKDVALPAVAISVPSSGAYVTSGNQAAFTVSGTCSEDTRTVSVSDGTNSASPTCSGGTYSASLNLTTSAQGARTITVTHTDAAGNSASATVGVTKDTVVPTVAITSPADASYINIAGAGSFTVSGTCSENGRTVAVACSGAGTCTSNPTCTSGTWSATFNFSSTADGAYNFTANHSDAAGNAATQSARSYTKDTVAPTLTITSPAANSLISASNASAYTVSGTCSENGRNVVVSGSATGSVACASGAWSIALDFSAAADGAVTINVNHSDAAGNAATQVPRSFTKDTALPTVTITGPAVNSYANSSNYLSFTYSGTCSEIGRNVSLSGPGYTGTATCAAGGTWSASVSLQFCTDGSFTARADHSDAAGNSATQATRTFVKDTVAPAITVTSPNGGESWGAGTNQSITWTATDTGGSGVANTLAFEYSTNGGTSWASVATNETNDGTYTWSVPGTLTTNALIRISGADLAGNTGTDSSNTVFTVNAQPAQLSFLPANGGAQPVNIVAGSPMTVKVAILDSFGNATTSTASVTVTLTPGSSTATVNAVNGIATFTNITFTTAGTYTLVATSTSLTNATSTSFTVSAGTATKLAFAASSPTTISQNTCSGPFILQSQDTYNNPSTLGSSLSITLSENGAGAMTFFSDSGCSTGIGTSTSIGSGSSQAQFYLKHDTIESVTLTATSTLSSPTRALTVQTPISLAKAIYASRAGYSYCAILPTGDVRCWGSNASGNLGDGQSGAGVASYTPTSVPNVTGVTALAMAGTHTCAQISDGTVKCWGTNTSGALGDGTTTSHFTAAAVSGITQSKMLTAGTDFTCALLANATVKCWGLNSSGQLGNNSTTNSPTPVLVSGLSDAIAISAGTAHACAVTASGLVKCWGANTSGQLGNNTTTSSSVPVTVSNISTAVSVALGEEYSCAILSDRTPRCWGNSSAGQMAMWGSSPIPVTISGVSNVRSIAPGNNHTCVSLLDGTAKCWGNNGNGELGVGNNTGNANPQVVPGLNRISSIVSARANSCALLVDGTIKCWGFNGSGSLGIGTSSDSYVPVATSGFSSTVSSGLLSGIRSLIRAKGKNTCVVNSSGILQCWGWNGDVSTIGLLGNGAVDNEGESPYPVTAHLLTGTGALVMDGTTATYGSCFSVNDGTARCWGDGASGSLGNGSTAASIGPVTVTGLTGVKSISVDNRYTYNHACAVLSNGTVKCWGNGTDYALGTGSTSNATTPATATGVADAIAIDTWDKGTCVLLANGTASCWGRDQQPSTVYNAPTAKAGISNGVALSLGISHGCYLIADGTVKCWGLNSSGQLGDGTVTNSGTPVTVSGLSAATSIVSGDQFSCALLADGTVKCWGSNYDGVLGSGAGSGSTTPVAITGLTNATSLVAGLYHACAGIADGTVKCWGGGTDSTHQASQIGDGFSVQRNSPTSVVRWIDRVGVTTGNTGSGGTTLNLTVPSGTKAGRLLVVLVSARTAGPSWTSITPPDASWVDYTPFGWTGWAGSITHHMFWRYATVADESATTFNFTLSPSVKASAVAMTYANAQVVGGTTADNTYGFGTTTLRADTVSRTQEFLSVLNFGISGDSTISTPTGYSLIATDASTGNSGTSRSRTWAAQQRYPANTTTGVITTSSGSSCDSIGQQLIIQFDASNP